MLELDTRTNKIISRIFTSHNHGNRPAPSAISLKQNLDKWIGYGICVYESRDDFRTVEQWCDPDPFDSNGNLKDNWILTLEEEDKGQITNSELAKRELPINGRRDLETEIKMNNGHRHDV